MAGRVTLIGLLIACIVAGCGGGASSISTAAGGQNGTAPSLAELNAMLQAEFDRLGIDPAKVTAAAPKGGTNAVFDLTAELIDADGAGGDPPTGIELRWTERLLGDYNQDGMVTQNDLTPIGQNYAFDMSSPQITYEAAELHGGLEYWPGGDPDDDGGAGGGQPPAAGSGAHNWRLARIDGNGDGFILMYDIPAIAQHWQEQLSGYRLYHKAPGEVEFSLAEMVTPAGRDGVRPVRYFHTDAVAAEGVYAFYVAPYDAATGQQGPSSGVLTIDTASGIVNQSPVAALTVTPDFAGAPAVITMDASASYDPDGTVAGYAWDFDGDGTDDWQTGDPVPEQSSTGTVTDITPGVDGVVTVTFTDGSADWKYPQVAAWDDEDARSLYTAAKLGISGWSHLPLHVSQSEYETIYAPAKIELDPMTGRIVLAASVTHPDLLPEQLNELALVRQQADGTWVDEIIPAPFWAEEGDQDVTVTDIAWDENSQPILLLNYRLGMKKWAWIAHRQSTGGWDFMEIETPAYPVEPSRIYMGSVEDNEPGRFSCRVEERLGDKKHIGGVIDFHTRSHVLFYDHGEWTIEYVGVDSAETFNWFGAIYGTTADEIHIMWTADGEMTGGSWWSRWESGIGLGEAERLDSGEVYLGLQSYCREAIPREGGTVVTLWEDKSNAIHYKFWLLETGGGETEAYNMTDISLRPDYEARGCIGLYPCERGIGMFVGVVRQSGMIDSMTEHWRLEGGNWLVETPMVPQGAGVNTPSYKDSCQDAKGEPVLLLNQYNYHFSGLQQADYIAEHLDPRL